MANHASWLRLCVVLLGVGMASASDTDTLKSMRAAISQIEMSESSNARAEAAESLAQMTEGMNPSHVDDQTLLDLVSLLGNSDDSVSVWLARCLGNLGPRSKQAVPVLLRIVRQTDCVPLLGGVSAGDFAREALKRIGEVPPNQSCGQMPSIAEWNHWIAEATASVRKSEFPGLRAMGALHLDYLTFWIAADKIDEANIDDIVALLDIPDTPTRIGVARALEHIGPRARIAVPKLEALLARLDCSQSDGNSVESLRSALRKMGVNPSLSGCGKSINLGPKSGKSNGSGLELLNG